MRHNQLHNEDGWAQGSRVVRRSLVAKILNARLAVRPLPSDKERVRIEAQRKAIEDLITEPGKIQVVEGLAGEGWISLNLCQRAWEKAGKRTVGMALSAQAAKALQEGSGINSKILALRLLQQRLVVRDGRYWIRRSRIDCLRRQFHDKWSRD